MKEIQIGKNEAGQRADKFLRRYLPEAGSSFLYKQMRKKNITLNGSRMEGKELLAEGDSIRVFFSDETFDKFAGKGSGAASDGESAPDGNVIQVKKSVARGKAAQANGSAVRGKTAQENESIYGDTDMQRNSAARESKAERQIADRIPSMVIYEDADIAILSKPAGVLSQSSEKGEVSLVEGFRCYLRRKGELTDDSLRLYAPSVVNRLDRNTSGIILAAKTLPAARELSEKLKDRTIHKTYFAAVEGKAEQACDSFAWLKKDAKTNTVRLTAKKTEGASVIHTAWKPEAAGSLAGHPVTLVEVDLITGKTHQIRSHLAFVGHPILGDVKYGSKSINDLCRERYRLRRQFLHACRISFPVMHALPQLSKRTFTAEIPEDLAAVYQLFV